ncbi:type II secretion system protein [Candidatus Saccharibacteria bacterium]|nr:type II secretion system protein [Candidatus Saccharibacteria bacterium]MCB9834665.1 type II secretion system protein [Candidatus Nomurabacteria bacterium]
MQTAKKGFTLIEVIIVLAIAALIMVVVFNSVGGAQKSQRDSQRRTDLGYLVSQLEQYAGNNNGDYPDPGDLSNFTANYIDNNDKSFRDPVAGEHYVLEENTTLESQESPSGLCGGGEDLTESGYQPVYYNRLSRRSFVVEICLESGNYVQTNK